MEENSTKEAGNRKCLELALEGERLCKSGDFQGGIAFFEAAVKEGTQDMRTLSAIYSQLGNAYFYLNKYDQALRYHKLDLAIARTMRDRVGEGKASGNIGNTYKMLGRFDEAVECCRTHLNISRELNDQIGEGRALYNLGNVYHTKGKQMARLGVRDPGEFPDEVKDCLMKAVQFYEQNLALMTELGDKSAQGRACGNLGNTHYLLGNFNQAIVYHQERLKIAQEFGDLAAERRAQCNLGNANVFLGDFEKAIQNYEETLRLGQELGDKVIEAQACYSLGNCYTLLHKYCEALEYHLRHVKIAKELGDRVGEGRGCWSLSNSLSALGRHEEALEYAKKHLNISEEMNDTSGQETASEMISNITRVMREESGTSKSGEESGTSKSGKASHVTPTLTGKKRFSMDNMELLKLTPGLNPGHDEVASSNFALNLLPDNSGQQSKYEKIGQQSKYEKIEKQSKYEKIEKQSKYEKIGQQSKYEKSRIAAKQQDPSAMKKESNESSRVENDVSREGDVPDFLDMIASFQKDRMEDQRCQVTTGTVENKENTNPVVSSKMKSKPLKAPRHPLNRSVSNPGYPPDPNGSGDPGDPRGPNGNPRGPNGNPRGPNGSGDPPTSGAVPIHTEQDEQRDDLIDLIAGFQSERMADQRAVLPIERDSTNGSGNGRDRCPSYSLGPGNHNNNHPNAPRRMPPVTSGPVVRSRQMSVGAHALPDDDFFDMLMRCQSSRLEDQRAQIPDETCFLKRSSQCAITSGQNSPPLGPNRSTVPDDDFFSLILRFQAGRIDDQRSNLPPGSCVTPLNPPSNLSSSTAQPVSNKPVKSGRRSFYKSSKK